MNQIDLNRRHAVVAGGAQGIGLSVATRLLQSGASVSIWDCDRKVLDTAIEQIPPVLRMERRSLMDICGTCFT